MSEQTATDIHKDLPKIAPKRLNRRNGRDSGGFGSQYAGSERNRNEAVRHRLLLFCITEATFRADEQG